MEKGCTLCGSDAHETAQCQMRAAPAGEREAYEAWKLRMKPYGFDGFDAYQAGAAYQRAQQPQSAEAVPCDECKGLGFGPFGACGECCGSGRKEAQQPQSVEPVLWFKSLIGAECKPDGRCYDIVFAPTDGYQPMYATPQPSAGVVMPERKSKPYGKLYMPDDYEGWNACLDEFARLNGKEVGRG